MIIADDYKSFHAKVSAQLSGADSSHLVDSRVYHNCRTLLTFKGQYEYD